MPHRIGCLKAVMAKFIAAGDVWRITGGGVMTDYVLECGRPAPQRHAGADPSAQREGGPAMGPRMPGPVVFGEVEQQPLGAEVTDDLQSDGDAVGCRIHR